MSGRRPVAFDFSLTRLGFFFWPLSVSYFPSSRPPMFLSYVPPFLSPSGFFFLKSSLRIFVAFFLLGNQHFGSLDPI